MTRREDRSRIEARNVKSAVVRARIIAHIEQNGPATYLDLQAALGRSASTIYYHAVMLAKAGKIHSEPIYNEQNHGDEAVWHLGENPNKSKDPEIVRRQVKTWPLNHVRDSLVAAFFGPGREVRV